MKPLIIFEMMPYREFDYVLDFQVERRPRPNSLKRNTPTRNIGIAASLNDIEMIVSGS